MHKRRIIPGVLLLTLSDFHNVEKRRHILLPVYWVVAIIICLSFMMQSCSNDEEELQKFGERAIATIVNGEHLSNKRGENIYDVTVQFSTKEGKFINLKREVTRDEFNHLHKDQEVDLIYSKKDPTTIKLLVTSQAIEKYIGIKDRPIVIKDLTKLLEINKDSVGSFLNTISYKWVKHDSAWINERIEQFISINPERGNIMFGGMDARSMQIIPQLKEENFRQIGDSLGDNRMKFFESDKFFALVNRQMKDNTILTTLTLSKK
jgi:hypothetical protein